ncbi:MAG: hypothetical protein M1818_001761 [Claussenomyces sp. TS43310]|nr:MAG: hypothetical protein M1818_001761 [Claussenomyces sp. TS43310]
MPHVNGSYAVHSSGTQNPALSMQLSNGTQQSQLGPQHGNETATTNNNAQEDAAARSAAQNHDQFTTSLIRSLSSVQIGELPSAMTGESSASTSATPQLPAPPPSSRALSPDAYLLDGPVSSSSAALAAVDESSNASSSENGEMDSSDGHARTAVIMTSPSTLTLSWIPVPDSARAATANHVFDNVNLNSDAGTHSSALARSVTASDAFVAAAAAASGLSAPNHVVAPSALLSFCTCLPNTPTTGSFGACTTCWRIRAENACVCVPDVVHEGDSMMHGIVVCGRCRRGKRGGVWVGGRRGE